MITNKKTAITAAVVALVVSGCNLFKSSEDDTNGKVVGAGGTGNVGGTGASGGAGATGGAGTSGAGGAAGATAATCTGMAGPLMITVQAPGGMPYCIDRTEVTQADYALFLKENTAKPGSEDSRCQDNQSYEPLNNPPDSFEPKICTNSFNPTSTPNHPVVCIDWCDAQAFCKWAGKRLCGKVGGGPGSTSLSLDDPANPANDATLSQWFNACSQGGKTKYPYGDTYNPSACDGDAKSDGGGFPELANVGSSPSCRGTTAPFSSILDLSGSVFDLTDECVQGIDYGCAIRGGGKTSSPPDLACAFGGTVMTGQHSEDIGFRCCKDLP